jgi:SAM-dependent methyltransferase
MARSRPFSSRNAGKETRLVESDSDIGDKAGRSYWDAVWQGQPLPTPLDPRDASVRNHIERRFHQYFVAALGGRETAGRLLLEVGAGHSRWLPYFAREFGFAVSGIDYSPVGCAQGEAILRQAGVSGRVLLADFFAPPAEMLGAYDVVVSIGLVEHFDNTAACVASLARFLRPGGLLITVIPNLAGAVGWIQRRVCRAIYDVHVPLDREELRDAHEAAGLSVVRCDYFQGADLTAVNLACWSGRWFYPALTRLVFAGSLLMWALDEKGRWLRPSRLASRYVVCSARN